jgi:cytochrome P450
MDDPEHARQRRMVTARFSVKRAETLRPAIQKMVDGLIDDILAGPKPVDLVQAFALPLPSLVTCEMLGVPYDDHVFLQDSTGQTMQLYAAPEEVAEGDKRLLGYVHRVLADKLASPGDDLFSEIADHVKRDELSRDQAARMMVMLILGGLDTTTNMIALSTMALLEHPDQLAILQDADDEKVVACAVEELLRYLSVAHVGQPRAALEDIQIGDQVISANDGMLLAVEGANWDPEVFPSPERLDLRRNTQGHVAFGFGTHQCLGQNLARVELQVACSTLFKRIPTLRLAVSPDHVAFKDSLVYGLAELPVTWESD